MNKPSDEIPCNGSALAWLALLLLTPLLVSCYATTDRPAVYEGGVLDKDEIRAISGSYHVLDPNGSISSISFTPRTDLWPYRREDKAENVRGTPRLLATADMSLRSVTQMVEKPMVWRIDGVAILSRIPKTELILVSVPGETVRIDVGEEHGLMPASDKNKNKNLFFIIKQSGRTMMVKLVPDTDKGLRLAFPDIKFASGLSGSTPPLPTERVLAYVKKNALVVFGEDEVPIYLRSTPEQKDLVEKRIQTAFEESRRVEKLKSSKKAGKASEFEVKVPKEAADALRKALKEPKQ